MTSECCDIPAPSSPIRYVPDSVTLYGVHLNDANRVAAVEVATGQELQLSFVNQVTQVVISPNSVVLAYGYSYAGHCYRFDEPRIFIVNMLPSSESAIGCGFDLVPGYKMWTLKSGSYVLEIDTNYDTVKSIVLESNLPGQRAPNTYSAHMDMAHRGRRLTRDPA